MFEKFPFEKRDKGIGKEFKVVMIGDRRNNEGLGF